MCEHCGYKLGENRVIQTITIFERDPGDPEGSLGAHVDGDAEYILSDQFTKDHDVNSFLQVGQVLDIVAEDYLSTAYDKAVERLLGEEEASVVDYTHLRLLD